MGKKVVIIGHGVSALTAAIYLARFHHDVTVLEGGNGSQIIETPLIENFPGFPDGISGFELIEKLKTQAEKFGAKLPEAGQSVKIVSVDKSRKLVYYKEDEGQKSLSYDALIFATGASHKKLENIFGLEDVKNGLHYCATCDGAFYEGKEVAVIGGGDSALTEALVLSEMCSKVYVIHRRDKFRASECMVYKISKKKNIYPVLGFNLHEIKTDEEGNVNGIVLKNQISYGTVYSDFDNPGVMKVVSAMKDNFVSMQIDGIFVAIGVNPNDEIYREIVQFQKIGNHDGIFACGDCVIADRYRQAIIAAGEGAKTAIDVNEFLQNSK